MDQDIVQSHISQQFNEELEDLRKRLLMMGGLVERQVQDAIIAITKNDADLAVSVRSTEKRVNELEIAIDEECTSIIALRQPAATDLRLVMAVSKAITDLERVGDEASKIAKFTLKLSNEGFSAPDCFELKHIGELVRNMLHRALDAFARFDVALALEVAQEDVEVDREYNAAMRQMVTHMMEDPRSISRVLNMVWSLRALERVGDHARNLAELVIYLVNGQDIRHRNVDDVRDAVLEKALSRN